MAFSTRSKRKQMFTEINITPLTDIFLVLLIIMMVIAPMLDSQGLKMSVPTISTSPQTKEEPKAISLHVSESGQYLLQNQDVASASLESSLKQMKTDFPDGLIIESEPRATHGAVVRAMDAARGAGISKIAVTQAQ